MQINYAGKISKNEYLNALLLHNRQRRSQKWILGIGLFLYAFSIVYLMIQNPSEEMVRYIFPGSLIPLVIFTSPWWIPYVQLSSYNQKGNIYRNNIFGLIDETVITINGGAVKVSIQWNAYDFYRITSNMLLLYQGKNNFTIFTKSMFSSQDDWDKFLALTKSKVSIGRKSA